MGAVLEVGREFFISASPRFHAYCISCYKVGDCTHVQAKRLSHQHQDDDEFQAKYSRQRRQNREWGHSIVTI